MVVVSSEWVGRFRMGPLARQEVEVLSIKERAMLQGSGSVSGSPGRLHDNISRDSGVGGLNKVRLLYIFSHHSSVK